MSNKICVESENKIIDLYNDGYGTLELAKIFNLNRSTIQRIIKRNNIKLRKTTPYKNKYNVKFFDSYTIESCYWAGFIFADGCIRSDRDSVEIGLMESDRDHLLKFAKAIKFQGNLNYDKCSKAYRISISGKWFPNKLKENFEIYIRKSMICKFPNKIPKNLLSHFIRGYFDGDGCITRTTCPTINFIGTDDFLLEIGKIFYNNGIRLKSKNIFSPLINTKSKNISHIHYFGKNAFKVLDYIYHNSNEDLRLARKYEKYKEYFKR